MATGQSMRTAIVLVACACTPAFGQANSEVYTLYRNSIMDTTMRVHVASFDSANGKDYNAENCFLTSDLYQDQEGVQVRFWCEPGRYRQ